MDPRELTLVTWNIDGLDTNLRMERTRAVIETLTKISADIVFLQEVIPETFSLIKSEMTDYECFAAGQSAYFVATLMRRGRVVADKHQVLQFPNTRMGRHVLTVQAHCGNVVMDLLNTHLESTAGCADKRMRQLRECFNIMTQRPEDRTVIFAGDLNLRDEEVIRVGGLPLLVTDVWEQLGRRDEVKWTWNMEINNNLKMEGRRKPRYRFDRVYIRPSKSGNMTPDHILLLGQEKVEGTKFYPSDHWGVRVELKLSPDCNKTVASKESVVPCKELNSLDLFDDGYHIKSEREKCEDDDEAVWIHFNVDDSPINEQRSKLQRWLDVNKPSQVRRENGVGWISISKNMMDLDEEDIKDVEEDDEDEEDGDNAMPHFVKVALAKHEWKVLEKEGGQMSLDCVNTIASKYDIKVGKWMRHLFRRNVDKVWQQLALSMLEGRLGPVHSMKVSPADDESNERHVICIYNPDYQNRDEVMRAENLLRQARVLGDLNYKPDIFTYLGIYRFNEWGIKPTIYNSTTVSIPDAKSRIRIAGSEREYTNSKNGLECSEEMSVEKRHVEGVPQRRRLRLLPRTIQSSNDRGNPSHSYVGPC